MTKSRTGHTLLLLWISSQTPGDQFKGLQSESVLSPCMHINSCSLCETSDQNLCWWNIATDRRQSLIWIIPDVSWGKRSELQKSASQQLYPINLFEFCSSPMVTSVQETKPFHFIQFRTKCKHKAKAFFAAGHRTKHSLHRFLYKCLLMHSAYRPDRNPAGSVIGAITFSLRLTTSKL